MTVVIGDDVFAVRHGDDRQAGVITLRIEHLRERLLTPDQLDQLPPPALLIEDILVRNTLAALYGKPGTGKSFVAMDWALSVATGTWWFRHEVSGGNVLYIAAEGSAGLPQRKRAWEKARNVPVSRNIHWLPVAVNLLDAEWSQALVTVAAELDPSFVVIDTLARSMPGGDENSPKDMSRLVDNADRLRTATAATVLLVHHTPKDGETLRGHSSLEGAVDTAVEVKADGMTVALKVAKQKDLPKGDIERLRLHPTCESAALYSQNAVGVPDEMGGAESTLLQAALESCGSDGLSATNLLKVSGLPTSSFFRAKKALLSRGLLDNIGTEKQPRFAPTNYLSEKDSQ